MMLRHKGTQATVWVADRGAGTRTEISLERHLSRRQLLRLAGQPEMVWQLARYLAGEPEYRGKDIAVYASLRGTLNDRETRQIISPDVDLLSVPYLHHRHNAFLKVGPPL